MYELVCVVGFAGFNPLDREGFVTVAGYRVCLNFTTVESVDRFTSAFRCGDLYLILGDVD